jgi:hypothetical protein
VSQTVPAFLQGCQGGFSCHGFSWAMIDFPRWCKRCYTKELAAHMHSQLRSCTVYKNLQPVCSLLGSESHALHAT